MLSIRRAHFADAATMSQIRKEAIRGKVRVGHPYSQATLDAWLCDGSADRVARYAGFILDPEYTVLLADAGDRAVGFAILNAPKEEFTAIYVKPNGVGRVGRALVSAVENVAFETASSLRLVASLNALPFYRDCGYVDAGNTHWTDGTGASVPCMKMLKRRP